MAHVSMPALFQLCNKTTIFFLLTLWVVLQPLKAKGGLGWVGFLSSKILQVLKLDLDLVRSSWRQIIIQMTINLLHVTAAASPPSFSQ